MSLITEESNQPRTTDGEEHLELRWEEIAASDLVDHPDLLRELLARERDGVTITGVFSPEEIDAALDRFAQMEDRRDDSLIGHVIGRSLGDVGPEHTDRTWFLEDAERAAAAHREGFGVDPMQRLADVLAPAAGDLDPCVATEGDRPYNAGQLRWFEPGRGGLRAHAGNEFREILKDGGMSHLVTTTAVQDHLSYFVVLQRPEAGGSLSVYDLVWTPETQRDENWSEGYREDAWIEDVPHITVDPDPGSLVMFGGGWRWHRIEPVEGARPRMTWGGFCAPSLDGHELHFWT